MKTEQHAAPSGPVFTSVKEIEASIKTRMEKALSDLVRITFAISPIWDTFHGWMVIRFGSGTCRLAT